MTWQVALFTPLRRSISERLQRNTAALSTAIQNIACCWLVVPLTRLAVQPYEKPLSLTIPPGGDIRRFR